MKRDAVERAMRDDQHIPPGGVEQGLDRSEYEAPQVVQHPLG